MQLLAYKICSKRSIEASFGLSSPLKRVYGREKASKPRSLNNVGKTILYDKSISESL